MGPGCCGRVQRLQHHTGRPFVRWFVGSFVRLFVPCRLNRSLSLRCTATGITIAVSMDLQLAPVRCFCVFVLGLLSKQRQRQREKGRFSTDTTEVRSSCVCVYVQRALECRQLGEWPNTTPNNNQQKNQPRQSTHTQHDTTERQRGETQTRENQTAMLCRERRNLNTSRGPQDSNSILKLLEKGYSVINLEKREYRYRNGGPTRQIEWIGNAAIDF